jgi:hypothetical protein
MEGSKTPHCTEILKQIFTERKLCGIIPNFCNHVSVSVFYIPTIGPPIFAVLRLRTDCRNI